MSLKRLVAGATLRRAASSPRERIAMRPRRASGLGMDKVSAFLVELSRRERATASKWLIAGPHAEHDGSKQGGVEGEAGGDGREEAGDAEIEPVQRGEPGAGADEKARRIGAHRPEAAAEALADEEQPESKPEAHIGRPDDPQIQRAETGDLRVVAEQAHPEARPKRDDGADRAADRRDRDRSRPGDPPRPPVLPGAPVRPDHGDDRGAEAEGDRLHDVFEARAHGVADRGLGSELPGDPGQENHGQVGDRGVDEPGHADLQDVGEQLPARHDAAELQPDDRARRAQIPEHDQAAAPERDHEAQPAPAGPSAGIGPQPKISAGEMAMWTTTQATSTAACRLMLPVPRTALPRRLSTQMPTAPPNATFAYESASASISSRPPIHRKMTGEATSIAVEKAAAS